MPHIIIYYTLQILEQDLYIMYRLGNLLQNCVAGKNQGLILLRIYRTFQPLNVSLCTVGYSIVFDCFMLCTLYAYGLT